MDIHARIERFLSQWEHRTLLDGVLLTGSRSVGNAAENSDIDLQILLSSAAVRERGNQIIDGAMIEYFANPTICIRCYFQQEAATAHRPTLRMYATGTILYDPSGVMEVACAEAKRLLAEPLPAMTAAEVESAKYSIWDCVDDLDALYRTGSAGFPYVYHLNLNKVLNLYGRFLRTELTAPSKQLFQFTDKHFRSSYGLAEFPDQRFAGLFVQCISATDIDAMYAGIQTLAAHVLQAMDGFEIDGWRSRIAP